MSEENQITSKLIIAAAGSGKTTHIVKEALLKTDKVLITTYTDANAESIRQKIIEINGFIPEYVMVQTWFSFLLQHGVKPYQGDANFPHKDMWNTIITGCVMPAGNSSTCQVGNRYFQLSEDNPSFYFSTNNKIYTDKLAKFAIRCNKDDQVISRISAIFKYIFIDEIQDFAGYDLDFLELLIKSSINLLMVGDPRQTTYTTSNVRKNSAYAGGKVIGFIKDKELSNYVNIDTESLCVNHRCDETICTFSNLLYPDLPQTSAENSYNKEHKGIWLIKEHDVKQYVDKFKPVQLRWDIHKEVSFVADSYNLGEAKGLEFDRVLIYPTEPFKKWLQNHSYELKSIARTKFYVGLTRAKYSVGIVTNENVEGIENWVDNGN